MATGFVISTPIWITYLIKNGFNIVITFFVVISYYHLITTYIKFNPNQWKRKKEVSKYFNRLSLEEKEKMVR